jgi:bifunctional non-homologous end joining protein LigD
MKQGSLAPSSISFIEPMKARTVQALPVGNWLYEVKFDGYRALAFKSGKETRLVSRNQKDFTIFLQLKDALKLLPAEQAVIDGEITALDSNGKPSFQLLLRGISLVNGDVFGQI